jgi:hypothetical protein
MFFSWKTNRPQPWDENRKRGQNMAEHFTVAMPWSVVS